MVSQQRGHGIVPSWPVSSRIDLLREAGEGNSRSIYFPCTADTRQEGAGGEDGVAPASSAGGVMYG